MASGLVGDCVFVLVTNVGQTALPVCAPANARGLFSYKITAMWTAFFIFISG
jgi:hypothetical protein